VGRLWRDYNLRVVAGVLFLVTWTVDALVRSKRLVWFLPDALLRLYPGELAVRSLAPTSVGVPHLLPHPGGVRSSGTARTGRRKHSIASRGG
jgi:hypothetical protein